MLIALIQDGNVAAYPYSVSRYRREHPNVSLPMQPTVEQLEQVGLFEVAPVVRPAVDHTKNVTEGAPQIRNNVWTQVWQITDATPEQIAERTLDQEQAVRAERDALLRDKVDAMNPMRWETLDDEQKQAWRDYRDALLAVPEQSGFPWDIAWPVAP